MAKKKSRLGRPLVAVPLLLLLFIGAGVIFFVIGSKLNKTAADELKRFEPKPTGAPISTGSVSFAKLYKSTLPAAQLQPFVSDVGEPHGLGYYNGTLYVSDWENKSLSKVTPDTGQKKVLADELDGAHDMVQDDDGKLVVALYKENRVVRVDPKSGKVNEVASGLSGPNGIARARNGGYYVTNAVGGTVVKIGTDNAVRTIASGLKEPAGIVVDNDNIIRVAQFADTENAVVQVQDNGKISTVVKGLVNAESLLYDSRKNLVISHVVNGRGALSIFFADGTQHVVLQTELPGPIVGPVTDGTYLYLESAAKDQHIIYRIPLP